MLPHNDLYYVSSSVMLQDIRAKFKKFFPRINQDNILAHHLVNCYNNKKITRFIKYFLLFKEIGATAMFL